MTSRGTRLVVGLIATVLLASCAGTTSSASPSNRSASSPESSTTPTSSGTPEPTPTPTEELLAASAYGVRASVLVNGLRVRTGPSLSADVTGTLDKGTEIRLLEGPVGADGFMWFRAAFGSDLDARYPGVQAGWLAADTFSSSGGEILRNPFIETADPVCPPRVDAELLAGLSPVALDACNVKVDTLHGLIDWCTEGPFSPLFYEPRWVYFSCPFLRSEPAAGENAWSLNLAFPPDVKQPKRGDVVTLHGRIGFDTRQYGECLVDALEPTPDVVAALDREQQLWGLECQLMFVVSDVVVEDHVELPSP